MLLINVSPKYFTVCRFWSGSVCFLIWQTTHVEEVWIGSWNVFTNHQCANCQLAPPDLCQRQKLKNLVFVSDAVLTSHEDCRRCSAPRPTSVGGPWTQPSTLRAELCKYAHNPFLLPSAGLNANSKYSHRAALRAMENSNKYCRNNSKLTTRPQGGWPGSLESRALPHLELITSLHIVGAHC